MPKRLFKELERAYGFDDVAIVPGQVTINPDLTSTKLTIGDRPFDIPFLASAMDGAVSPHFATLMHQMGGLGVLNAEGLYTRYEDPHSILEEIISMPQSEVTEHLQQVYSAPIQEHLIGQRVQEIRKSGATCAVSFTPQNTKRMSPLAVEAGADIVVVQSTVTTARHMSRSYRGLIFSELINTLHVPVVVGNCVTYSVAQELMETGIDGILVGVGPGSACTTREVVGVGVPQVTATLECAAAREDYFRRTGRYVAVITDGGLRTGGDVCKAIASGADGVMLGTPFAQAEEAPGQGYNWGMANAHPELPRGTRIHVGIKGTLRQILYGPTSVTDGTQNLVGALRVAMGMCGAYTVRDLHKADMVIAPSIKTEGKFYQVGL
ncbi:MAG: GuaB3 family IMP dehydrogenase-related protein [Chloroflexi bacterium]|nr:GuaB3 family IMP dehydrogenase-related protein [Chloroflexota bacterium]MCI0779961.1 GuaB3 family IMP dehydrogenase-related protein [Chloroflexota bacterium]MCI0786458.1 GuaB3 family IMP dehydrogenase-related protein [Chloroflexota bacterium]MCI0793815.1 GuaB3 family IMP dehydrogenase-related protein [Chloroflexota bacterium]MCI0823876.1 GuaB3 family IMP dehydrogenase-related protein [Chloroflexota bacterium]